MNTIHKTVDEETKQKEAIQLQGRMADIKHKLLVLSGKGGVGKSTVAVNLAVALAKAGQQVGLLDVDIHGPSVPKLTGLEGEALHSNDDGLVPVKLGENLAVMSIGFLLGSGGDAVIWRGPLKYQIIRQFLKDVAWGHLDYLVVDCPPGTGDEPLSVAQLAGSNAQGIVVTTPQQVSISEVRRCITFCNQVSLPVLGILENMSGFVCPRCGERIDLFRSGGGEALAREAALPFLGRIPFDTRIVTSGEEGIPFVTSEAGLSATVVNAVVEALLSRDQAT